MWYAAPESNVVVGSIADGGERSEVGFCVVEGASAFSALVELGDSSQSSDLLFDAFGHTGAPRMT